MRQIDIEWRKRHSRIGIELEVRERKMMERGLISERRER